MYLRRVARTLPNGASVPNGTSVALHLHVDDQPIATTTIQGGHYVFQLNGNPGPHYTKLTYEGQTQIISSKAQGVSGTVDVGNIPLVTRAFSDGYIPGALNHLAPSATGTNMNVTVATGAAIVRGILYDQFQALPIAIAAANLDPRIDRIVVEVVPTGGGENIEGRSRVVVKQGTPAVSPVAPALVQTATLWEYSLATVLVDPSVTAIAANKVTDTRTISQPIIQPGTVAAAQLAADVREFIDDTVGGLIVGGANVVTTYDDSLGLLSVAVPNENIDDRVAALVIAGFGITKTYDDVANTLTLAAIARPTFMPGSEYVATGSLASGSRTLKDLSVGPLVSGVVYDIRVQNFCTLRGTGNTGTVSLNTGLVGGTLRTHEFQHVGTAPRGALVTQTESVTGAGGFVTARASVTYVSGDACDVRAGELSVIAIPR